MISIRALSRAAPRLLGRVAPVVSRGGGGLGFGAVAAVVVVPRIALAFSTSTLRPKKARDVAAVATGQLQNELATKLQSEIELEKEMLDTEDSSLGQSIKAALAEHNWKVESKDGGDEVRLIRQVGNDKITVTFSLTDMSSWNPPGNEGLDEDIEQDEGEENDPDANEEDANEVEDGMEEDNMDGQDEPSPIPLNIVIEKAGRTPTVLAIEAAVMEGAISIEDIRLFDSAKLAIVDSPESAMARASLYAGPQFNTLDEDLQMLMERYLEERGVNSDLAVLVSDFVQHKEQKEYVRWLHGIKAFVEA